MSASIRDTLVCAISEIGSAVSFELREHALYFVTLTLQRLKHFRFEVRFDSPPNLSRDLYANVLHRFVKLLFLPPHGKTVTGRVDRVEIMYGSEHFYQYRLGCRVARSSFPNTGGLTDCTCGLVAYCSAACGFPSACRCAGTR